MPYLRIGAVIAVAAGIVAVGVLGPHPSLQPTATLQPAATQMAAAPSARPSAAVPAAVAGLTGIGRFPPAPLDLRTSWLAGNISSQALAAIGTRLFFVTHGNTIESTDVGSGLRPRAILNVPPCHSITQLAAAGNLLGYVETAPAPDAAQPLDCGLAPAVSWTIWLGDLAGGHRRRIASGVRSVDSADTRQHPVYLALTTDTYAFDRPNSPGLMAAGETVVIRTTSGDKLLWTLQTDDQVAGLMLGGSTLAVLEREPGLELSVADATNPALTSIARPISAASLSADGRYLAWDTAADPALNVPAGVATLQLRTGGTTSLPVAPSSPRPDPLRPVVSSGASGPILAWYATAQDGISYAAFRDVARDVGGFYSTVQAPFWISLNGSTLILVSTDSDAGYTVAFALDLAGSGFKTS